MKKIFYAFTIFFLILELNSHHQPRKLKFKEEFYRLYYLPSYANKYDYARNIFWLEIAIKAPWAPPIQALIISEDERSYQKYQLMLYFHLNYLMARNTMYWASRYDKHEPVWFNKTYKEDILKSLEIAKYHYNNSLYYWQEMLNYKEQIQQIHDRHLNLEFINNVIFKIDQNDINFERVINRQLKHIEKTKNFLGRL